MKKDKILQEFKVRSYRGGKNGKPEEELERAIGEIGRNVRQIHDVQPFAVLLTATSSVTPGIAIKEAWKNAYPNEKPPYFLMVDPRTFMHKEGDYRERKKIDKFIAGHSERPGEERILVFDEFGGEMNSPQKGVGGNSASFAVSKELLRKGGGEFGEFEYKDVWVLQGNPSKLPLDPKIHERIYECFEGKRPPGYKRVLRGKEGKEVIKYFKSLGREAGEELREELGHRKGLEQQLTPIIAVSSLALSIFFLSSNLTGFAVGSLNQTNLNWTGGILFLIGVVAAVFYFKKK